MTKHAVFECRLSFETITIQHYEINPFTVGYTTRDIIYKWNSARQVAIAEDMKLSQFDLVANPTANRSAGLSHGE